MDDVPLREFIERILDEREKAHNATFQAAMREADNKAKELERRLEGLNELRQEVTSDRSNFVTRTEWALRHDSMENTLNELKQWKATVLGYGGAAILTIGFISTVVSVLLSWWLKQ